MTETVEGGAADGDARSVLVSLERVGAGRTRPVLDGLDWVLREGELWALVGPNGAGKSTLLRVLRGWTPVSAGEVRYGSGGPGRALAEDPWGQVLHVSFAAQSSMLKGAAGYAQSRWHGGQDEDVARARDVLGASLELPECRRIVRALSIDGILDRRVTELSNGERRKLLIARAAAKSPLVLALDNPFNGLDHASRQVVVDALRRLHGEGLTIVLATSRADEIPDVATHVLLLDRGRVVVSGPRAAVQEDERFAGVMGAVAPLGVDRAPVSGATSGVAAGRASAARERGAVDGDGDHGLLPGAPVVELREVGVRYGGTDVLHGIDWTVRRGERWVVVGANGAGKSALLSLVLTDNPQAYANDVSLFGRRRGSGESIWEIRERIGCVSPEMHLYCERDRRVLDVVRSGFRNPLVPSGGPRVREVGVAEACLEALGMADRRDRAFGELSEGERQLVLVGRALVTRPELLVLDEPSQGLDRGHRDRMLDLVEDRLRETDATLILVTHDLEDVPSSATHGLLLRRGRTALAASLGEVLEAYLAPDYLP